MKFRKRPVVVEAVRFFANGPLPDGVCVCAKQFIRPYRAHIHTLEGLMFVNEGDWVITGVAGEHYPCRDDIFQKTYEAVEP